MMKRILAVVWALAAVCVASADPAGDRALADLSQRMKALGHYESEIVIDAGDSKMAGRYRVSGKDYHIDMGSVEFWGNGERRYEVSHKIEEVVVTNPQKERNTLLGNPSEVFDLADKGFEVVSRGGVITLTRIREVEGLDVDVIEIVLGSDDLPSKIVYRADSDAVEISLSNIKSIKSTFRGVDLSKYRKYDFVELF